MEILLMTTSKLSYWAAIEHTEQKLWFLVHSDRCFLALTEKKNFSPSGPHITWPWKAGERNPSFFPAPPLKRSIVPVSSGCLLCTEGEGVVGFMVHMFSVTPAGGPPRRCLREGVKKQTAMKVIISGFSLLSFSGQLLEEQRPDQRQDGRALDDHCLTLCHLPDTDPVLPYMGQTNG